MFYEITVKQDPPEWVLPFRVELYSSVDKIGAACSVHCSLLTGNTSFPFWRDGSDNCCWSIAVLLEFILCSDIRISVTAFNPDAGFLIQKKLLRVTHSYSESRGTVLSEDIGLLKTHWGTCYWSALWRCVMECMECNVCMCNWNVCEASSYFGPKLFVWNCIDWLGVFLTPTWNDGTAGVSVFLALTYWGQLVAPVHPQWRGSEQLWLVCPSSFSGLVLFWLRCLKYLKNSINFWCVLEAAMMWEILPTIRRNRFLNERWKGGGQMLLTVVKSMPRTEIAPSVLMIFFSLKQLYCTHSHCCNEHLNVTVQNEQLICISRHQSKCQSSLRKSSYNSIVYFVSPLLNMGN